MLGIFYKNKGAISVFLTLILVPVLLMTGLTTDAARIYMSEAVISDAGEMAMNAALAQYNVNLHDEYGLLVMDKSPEAMKEDLKGYFDSSLNGTGLPESEDYKRILDLLTKNFEAINVLGSEIYKTEVEKQQILEYMKYRAPVCLTELVIEKIKELKGNKKVVEAMEAEMDFGEAMSDCQDAFKKAKETTEDLNTRLSVFHENEIESALSSTQNDYKESVSRNFLMLAEIQKYDQSKKTLPGSDIKAMVEQFIATAETVDLSAPYSSNTFDAYIKSILYKNTVESLGGVGKLKQEFEERQAASETGSETDGESAGTTEANDEERKELEKLTKEYKDQVDRIADYSRILYATAEDKITNHSGTLNMYWNWAKLGEESAKNAENALDEVKKKLENAKNKFDVWNNKNNELATVGKNTESKDQEVGEYRDFFYSGDGKEDKDALATLISSVRQDKEYFKEWKEELEKEKFHGQSIAKVGAEQQIQKYKEEAKGYVTGKGDNYSKIESARQRYITKYEHTAGAYRNTKVSIADDPFYQKLQQYCNKEKEDGSTPQEGEANGKLDQGRKAGEEAKKQDNFPTFNWDTDIGGVTLPSAKISQEALEAVSADLDSDGNVKKNQKDALAKFRKSISEAASFLDAVDRIVGKGAENLYIAEYAMQMFSYYTVGKEDGEAKDEKDILSISGYKLTEHKAYQAECEYILWGNKQSQVNVANTFLVIFGIRLLLNSFFAFTDGEINGIAQGLATAIVGGWAPYLVPIVKILIKLGYAGIETAADIIKLKDGYGVTIIKNRETWATLPNGDNTKGVTFDYSEYLRIFLNISMILGKEESILARIADCIQVNTSGTDLLQSYTMIAIHAEVSSRTTFMRKISDLRENGTWKYPDDNYTVTYQSILGY